MAHTESHGTEHSHHIIPKKTLFAVFGALVFLTVLTVAVAQIDLGSVVNIILALGIASVKAALVVTFFMALKYDTKVNTMVFSIGTIFVGVFLVFTLFDTAFRGDLGNVSPETISAEQRKQERLQAEDPGTAGLLIAPSDSAQLQQQQPDTASAAPTQEDTSAAASPDTTPGEGH